MTNRYTLKPGLAISLMIMFMAIPSLVSCDSQQATEPPSTPDDGIATTAQNYTMMRIGPLNNLLVSELAGDRTVPDGRELARAALEKVGVADDNNRDKWIEASDELSSELINIEVVAADLAEIEIGLPEKLLAQTAVRQSIGLVLINVDANKMARLTNDSGTQASVVVLRRKENGSLVVVSWGDGSEPPLTKPDFERVISEIRKALNAPL